MKIKDLIIFRGDAIDIFPRGLKNVDVFYHTSMRTTRHTSHISHSDSNQRHESRCFIILSSLYLKYLCARYPTSLLKRYTDE